MNTQMSTSVQDHPDEKSNEDRIRELLRGVAKAVRIRDLNGILAAYAPYAVIFDVRDSLQYRGKDALKKSWQECFANTTNFSYEIDSLEIKVSDDMAFSHALSHATGRTTAGKALDLWMRCTNCYIKLNDKWLVVHEHLSVPSNGHF